MASPFVRIGVVHWNINDRRHIELAIKTLFLYNLLYLQEFPSACPVLLSGAVYENEPVGYWERWLTIPEVIERGAEMVKGISPRPIGVDCKSLACARAAEIVFRDKLWALPRLVKYPGVWHVIVEISDGKGKTWTEDPSALLGMRMEG